MAIRALRTFDMKMVTIMNFRLRIWAIAIFQIFYTQGGFLKWRYPQIIHFNGIFYYKLAIWVIWGYPHLWKPPYGMRQRWCLKKSKHLGVACHVVPPFHLQPRIPRSRAHGSANHGE